jgi:hypothetical protein
LQAGSPKSQALIFLASSLYQDKEEDSTCATRKKPHLNKFISYAP